MNGIMIVLTLLSGVALFLYGMSLMGDGLKRVAGNQLELVLYKLTNTPIKRCTSWNDSYSDYSVIFRNDRHGCRIRKFGNDESRTGDWNYHGSKYRYECYRMDSLSFLY